YQISLLAPCLAQKQAPARLMMKRQQTLGIIRVFPKVQAMSSQDVTQRFLFEHADVRGELVSLNQSYNEILAKHTYPEPVKALLGEMLAAAVLLSTAIKFDGLLIMQARSSGPLSTDRKSTRLNSSHVK